MALRTYPWDVSRLATLKNRRVFLTGGTGFFGKWLIRFFVETAGELGVEVVVLSRDPTRFRKAHPKWGCAPNISFTRGDVRSFDFPSGDFDFVIHAAAPVGSEQIPYDSPEMYSIIVDGAAHVLDFAEQAGAARFLHVSSGAVYGIQPAGVMQIEETAACAPTTAYGKAKLRSEDMCLERNIEGVVARCFAFVGEYLQLDNRFAIGNFILDGLYGRNIEISGDGTPLRSYMHGADLVEWLMAMLVRGTAGEIYNVGSDQAISIADLAQLVKTALGSAVEVCVQTPADPVQQPSRYVPSIQKAIQQLDVSMKMELKEAIVATAREWKVRDHVI